MACQSPCLFRVRLLRQESCFYLFLLPRLSTPAISFSSPWFILQHINCQLISVVTSGKKSSQIASISLSLIQTLDFPDPALFLLMWSWNTTIQSLFLKCCFTFLVTFLQYSLRRQLSPVLLCLPCSSHYYAFKKIQICFLPPNFR